MTRRLPHLSRGSMALVLNAALALVALGLAFAPPGEGAPKYELAAADGSLSLLNSKEGVAVFQASQMRPGESAGGSVTITNTGTVNAALTLAPEALTDAPGATGAALSKQLELRVVDVSTTPTVVVYEGMLRAMGDTNVGSLAPGGSRTYSFEATLKPPVGADNAYQGAAVSTGFRWNATGISSPTATPTPTATPSPTATPVAISPPATGSGAAPPSPPLPASDPAADPSGELLGSQLFALPAATRKCVSRRKFAIHVRRPKGITFKAIAVTVNGRTKVRLKGVKAKKVKATVNLKGLPAGKVRVKITATLSNGRKAVSKRTYTTCAAKKKTKKKKASLRRKRRR